MDEDDGKKESTEQEDDQAKKGERMNFISC